jgi:hypothetical protein
MASHQARISGLIGAGLLVSGCPPSAQSSSSPSPCRASTLSDAQTEEDVLCLRALDHAQACVSPDEDSRVADYMRIMGHVSAPICTGHSFALAPVISTAKAFLDTLGCPTALREGDFQCPLKPGSHGLVKWMHRSSPSMDGGSEIPERETNGLAIEVRDGADRLARFLALSWDPFISLSIPVSVLGSPASAGFFCKHQDAPMCSDAVVSVHLAWDLSSIDWSIEGLDQCSPKPGTRDTVGALQLSLRTPGMSNSTARVMTQALYHNTWRILHGAPAVVGASANECVQYPYDAPAEKRGN